MQTKSTSQGEQRLQVPRVFLERTSQDLNEHVEGCLAELVFNLQEAGMSDWEDRNTRKAGAAREWKARRYIMEYLEM
jgi:hypothetical protein